MRVRKKKHGEQRIEAQKRYLCTDPGLIREDINAPFGRVAPLRLEIGCGKGGFILGESARLPDRNFYAVEMISDVMVTALEKYASENRSAETDNVRFIIANAGNLEQYFTGPSFETIYINFCDPWPKAGHAKRRLVHRDFLKMYREIALPGGRLRFKTDNGGLFDFAEEELASCGMRTVFHTRDLHSSLMARENVMTEYEAKFTGQGVRICMLEAELS